MEYTDPNTGEIIEIDEERLGALQQMGEAPHTDDEVAQDLELVKDDEIIGTTAQQCALFAALAEAQGMFDPITIMRKVTIKPREKPQYTFEYAEMGTVINATRPALRANGLAVLQILTLRGNDFRIRTRLVHKDGGQAVSLIVVSTDRFKEDKDIGSSGSYMRRYAYNGILCLAADTEPENDGEGEERGQLLPPDKMIVDGWNWATYGWKEFQQNFYRGLSDDEKALLGEDRLIKMTAEARKVQSDIDAKEKIESKVKGPK